MSSPSHHEFIMKEVKRELDKAKKMGRRTDIMRDKMSNIEEDIADMKEKMIVDYGLGMYEEESDSDRMSEDSSEDKSFETDKCLESPKKKPRRSEVKYISPADLNRIFDGIKDNIREGKEKVRNSTEKRLDDILKETERSEKTLRNLELVSLEIKKEIKSLKNDVQCKLIDR